MQGCPAHGNQEPFGGMELFCSLIVVEVFKTHQIVCLRQKQFAVQKLHRNKVDLKTEGRFLLLAKIKKGRTRFTLPSETT